MLPTDGTPGFLGAKPVRKVSYPNVFSEIAQRVDPYLLFLLQLLD